MRKAITPIFAVLSLFAQAPTGEISGSVTDASGAVVSGATVVITNPATNFQRTVQTNDAGIYTAPSLQPGIYNIKIEQQGFQTQTRNGVELQVGQTARLDFQLRVGNVSEVVEVTGGAPVLQTDSTEIGTVIENKRILELPLNGRNYLQLASLIPGATTNGPASSQGQQRMGGSRNQFALNIAGQRVHFNHYSLDGIENTDPNFNTYLLLPSLEALQEFKVEAGLFQAEYGRAIAQVNVSTKGGTNELHGTAFEFLRNAKLDAKNFFDRADQSKPPFKRNQFGFTVGGPVYIPKAFDGRNKLFFFANYEGLRERRALTQTATVPFAAQRGGDFSAITNRVLYDPLSRAFTGNAVTTATPFAGNRIPTNRIHANSAKVLADFYPLPNISQTVQNNNFLNNEGRRTNSDLFSFRSDFIESPNSNWFARYSFANERQYLPISIPDQGNNADVDPWQFVVANTRVYGGNKVNDARIGISYLKAANIQQRAFQRNVVQELNIPDVSRDFPLYWGIPVFQISTFSNVGECNDCPFVNYDTIIQGKDDFAWTRGKHAIKFGGEARRVRFNQIGAVVPRGRFTWDGRFTQGPSDLPNRANASGLPLADFLLGFQSNSEGQVGAPIANFRSSYFALYLQDTWRATPKLTINLGIRWEYDQPYSDKHDALVNVDFRWDNSVEPTFVRGGTGDPYEGNPPFPWAADVKYVRDGRFGRGAYMPDKNDIAPRLGIAYQLNSKTVLRTGAGVYFVRDIGNAVFDIVRNAPFTIRRNEPADTVRPNQSWARPFTITGNPTFLLINQYGERSTYIPQWSFGLQRELAAETSLEVTYMGSSGVKLRRLINYNIPGPAPFAAGNVNQRRPFTKFGQFQTMNAMAHSTYHALQARLQRRFANGLTVLGSYAYSKSIDAGSGIRTTDGDPLTPMDPYGLFRERGRSAYDFRQRLTTSWLYELPFGKGKRFLNAGGAGNVILGGWQLGGIFTLQSGFPLSVFCPPGNIQNGGDGCRSDSLGINPNLPRNQKTPDRFFNTAAFPLTGRIPGPNTEARYGDSGRNILDGPGIISFDFSAIKNFRLTEKTNLEFRGEFFNIPNHPIFAPPGTTPNTPAYGRIGGTKIDSRQLQFGLKFHF
ncbi:MAG: carboxypeptidase regulatory-like domain-containing protein [Acidobacteria bacterium]|nr:carboxypeptidase regulatory-like domain-containing protein [Acidobacteriota bacterium]